MKNSILPLTAFVILAACANSSPPNHYYLLTPAETSAAQSTVTLAQVTIPAYLDRSQIVRRNGSQLEMNEFERWGESFDGMVRRVLAADLAAQTVSGAPRAVKVTIDDFAADENGHVRLQAHWIFASGGKATAPRVHSFAQATAPANGDNAALAAAMSDLLRQLAAGIAQTE